MDSSRPLPHRDGADHAPGKRRKHAGRHHTQRPWWPWLKHGVTAVFFVLVVTLLVKQAHTIEWSAVLTSLAHYPVTAAWGAVALAAASFALYSCFDLLGRRYIGHKLSTPTVMMVTFVSYAFNLNLGSMVGGVAFRYRLYSRLGLGNGVIARIMSLSMLSNWMGYVLLAGLVFTVKPPTLPAGWPITAFGLRLAGIALLAVAVGYLAFCAMPHRRPLHIRGHTIDRPSMRMAGLQLLMGAGNWLTMSGIIFILLQHRIEFSAVVSVLLLAAVAGVITHIPGNLGVLEGVFVALLSHLMPANDLLAGLVAYRVIYYLIPLGIATLVYLVLETRFKKVRRKARPG